LENYVLAAIGELPPDRHTGVGQIVRQVFGGGADWMLAVRQQLRLDGGLDESIRQMWVRNQAVARQSAVTLQPVQFPKLVADQNFAALIGPALG
jgi:hypothetical protein